MLAAVQQWIRETIQQHTQQSSGDPRNPEVDRRCRKGAGAEVSRWPRRAGGTPRSFRRVKAAEGADPGQPKPSIVLATREELREQH